MSLTDLRHVSLTQKTKAKTNAVFIVVSVFIFLCFGSDLQLFAFFVVMDCFFSFWLSVFSLNPSFAILDVTAIFHNLLWAIHRLEILDIV